MRGVPGPLANLALDAIGRRLQLVERARLPPRDGVGEAVEDDGRRCVEVSSDVISHDADAIAVGAWSGSDAVLSRIAWPHGAPRVCLVGGAVRDALLGVTHGPDVDLVVEGDAIALAGAVGHQLGGRVIAHARFGTAR
ncbi:MAG: hypothetical protein FJW92_04860, partial [Actinobacteria bacterium]|nr:hypothetical protein [Actinomycetota bacterium]